MMSTRTPNIPLVPAKGWSQVLSAGRVTAHISFPLSFAPDKSEE